METQRFIQGDDQLWRERSNPAADPLKGDWSNLLGLCLGITLEPTNVCWQENLEGIHAVGVPGHWHNSDHAATESLGSEIRSVVAHYHGGAPLVCFSTTRGVQVNDANLASTHAYANPSPVVDSQSAAPSSAHWSQASS
jgi:hypothetical protein